MLIALMLPAERLAVESGSPMATVNTASLRSEFDALKALCADDAMSAESRALVEALLTLVQVLMAVFMEKNAPKGSHNSGLPSSRAEPDETARKRSSARSTGPKTAPPGTAQPPGRRMQRLRSRSSDSGTGPQGGSGSCALSRAFPLFRVSRCPDKTYGSWQRLV